MNSQIKNYIQLALGILIYFSYFLSYVLNENSIGSGGYQGDLVWIWRNFQIFLSNDLINSINHENFYGNRTPLFYILNVYLNPFINDIDTYRLSVFIFFTITPVIFYFTLKNYYENVNPYTLFCISTFILLSPYFRSSSVWGQEINYGIICIILSFFYFIKFKKNQNNLNLFLTVLFSSLCVYFDQKLLVVPLFCYLNFILFNRFSLKIKFFSTLLYFIFSLPFFYLITIWGGIVPPLTQKTNFYSFNSYENFNLHFYHVGFASTIIALYLIPLVIFKIKLTYTHIINFLQKNYLLILVPSIIYISFYIFFDWYDLLQSKQYVLSTGKTYGLGFINKLSIIFFDNISYRKIFIYFAFIGSWLLIIYAIKSKVTNWFIIIYFLILSLILLPIMQEYFDPYIFLLSLLMVNKINLNLNFERTIFSSLFFICCLTFAILYY